MPQSPWDEKTPYAFFALLGLLLPKSTALYAENLASRPPYSRTPHSNFDSPVLRRLCVVAKSRGIVESNISRCA